MKLRKDFILKLLLFNVAFLMHVFAFGQSCPTGPLPRVGTPLDKWHGAGMVTADSFLQAPNDTPKSRCWNNTGNLAVKSGIFYYYTGSSWVSPASAGATDTTSLSNRINQKINTSDSGSAYYTPFYIDAADAAIISEIPTNNNQLTNGAGYITSYTETDPLSFHKTDSNTAKNPVTLTYANSNYYPLASNPAGYLVLADIASKVNYTDTAGMLLPYLRKGDTASLSNRINQKLNSSDTAGLSNRINQKLTAADTASISNRINLKLNYSDTASLSNRINLKLNSADTASLSTRINLKLNSADTASLSTRINTKWNISDTGGNGVTTRWRHQKAIDSTTALLSNYTTWSTINTQSGTSYTLVASDRGKIVAFTSNSGITLTVPSGLGSTFYCTIQQNGSGQVTLSASGTTLRNRQSFTKTAGQYAQCSILFTNTTDTYNTQGDMQ
jgi:hypothetical protein